MAANSFFYFLCFLLLLLRPRQAEGNDLGTVSSILSEKGYHAMSLTFDGMFLDSLQIGLTANSTLTLFCPPDHAFLSSKLYPQPPLTLLQYHLVPSKLSRDELVLLPLGSKVETLLLGHPLVVTTLPGSDYVTLNEVRITEWEVHNDGGLIIHGVEDFFDPGFQTLRYPWYDAKEIHAKVADGFSWIMGKVTQNWILSLLMIAILVLIVVSSFSFCVEHRRHRDYQSVI